MRSLFSVSLLTLLAFVARAQEPPLVVESVECRGNATTSCDFIRDRLYIRVGAAVDEEEIGNAKLRLASLPNFTAVDIRLEKGSERGRARVVIEVAEADPWTKEAVIATAFRATYSYERVAARISNENLFGTGKVLSLGGGIAVPIEGYNGQSYSTRLQYVDPRLFDSRNYFLIAGAFYDFTSTRGNYGKGNSFDHKFLGADLTAGRRIFDFSYVSLGYKHMVTAARSDRILQNDGSFRIISDVYENLVLLTYGWNTEDNPFFPTHGSALQVTDIFGAKNRYHSFDYGYRQTWTFDNNIWTLKWQNAPGIIYRGPLDRSLDLALQYSRPIAGGDEIRRGRWYVELGQSSVSGHVWEIGAKAGLRLDTKSFGHIDFYVFGSDNVDIGGGK